MLRPTLLLLLVLLQNLLLDLAPCSALLRVEVSPNPAGVHWGIDNLRLIPVRHGYFDDFESPRELAEWSGSLDPLFTTHCGDPMNSILGGSDQHCLLYLGRTRFAPQIRHLEEFGMWYHEAAAFGHVPWQISCLESGNPS